MILIVNLKIIRNLFYLTKINNKLQDSKFIFFCYNVKVTQQLQTILLKNHIKVFFFKKLKCLTYLKFLTNTLSNKLVLFCCENTEISMDFLLAIENNILFAKIYDTYYSLNNFSKYYKSGVYETCFSSLASYYYTNIYLLLEYLKTKKN